MVKHGAEGSPNLSLGKLRRIARDLKANRKFPTERDRAYALASHVIAHFLGLEWYREHLVEPVSPSRSYFRLDAPKHTDDWHEHVYRTIDWGEALYNLQHVQGFQKCLQQIHDGHIESGWAELESGKFLWMYGVPFRFVEPTGVRGSSYDLEVLLRDRVTWIPSDTKSKQEATVPSADSILDSLREARRRNLPDDRPSFIFLRLTLEWHVPIKENTLVEDGINRFFRGTDKVASVKVHYTCQTDYALPGTRRILPLKEFDNPNCRFTSKVGWKVFPSAGVSLVEDLHWRSFGYMVR